MELFWTCYCDLMYLQFVASKIAGEGRGGLGGIHPDLEALFYEIKY